MCNRMTLNRRGEDVARELDAELDDKDAERLEPRFNVRPREAHWLLTAQGGARRIVPAVWGLPSKRRPVTIVRDDTIRRGAFRGREPVLVICDGFFEWRSGSGEPPFYFHRADGGLLLLAGVVAPLPDSPKAALAFSVITTMPNEKVAAVHDRMPAIIVVGDADRWLGERALELLAPAPVDLLIRDRVSKRVNYRYDDPECIAPIQDERPQPGKQLSLLDDD
jgi:putative SOS response-associated peptidase YedK